MSLLAKERCSSCGAEGRFLTLSEHGVCADCQSALRAELDALMRELPRMEKRFQKPKTAAKRQSLAFEMVSQLERVMAIEQLGIYSDVDTEVLLPSQWLSQYRSEHDWAAVEIVSDQFDALWDDLFSRPKSRATLRKLQCVKALADSTLPRLYSAEHITALHQQIAEKLHEITVGAR
jgi:hypothetical protein